MALFWSTPGNLPQRTVVTGPNQLVGVLERQNQDPPLILQFFIEMQ